MRMKKVNRYWCDFCNKAGLQAGAMRKHEAHCTMNPSRACRVCKLLVDGGSTLPLADLIAMLPDSGPYHAHTGLLSNDRTDPYAQLQDAVAAVLPAFREAAGNCPACMMAALRQANIPVPMVQGFDFKAEMKSIFDDINEARRCEGWY